MPFGSIGIWEILLVLIILLLVFGARRLPELGGALGKGIREFKSSIRDIEAEFNKPADEMKRLDQELKSESSSSKQTAEEDRAGERRAE